MFNPITTGNRITVGVPLQWVKHVYLGGQSPEKSTQAESGGTTKTTYLMTEVSWEVILCQLVNSYSKNSFPYTYTQNDIPEHVTLQLHNCDNFTSNNIPTTAQTQLSKHSTCTSKMH
jgi:hypothetical protein